MQLNDNVTTGVKKRSSFDLSYDGVLSQSWGDIVPIVCKEMVPGDSFTCDANAFIRLAPLASPTYGRIHGYINYFFVPNRILCEGDLWQNFIRGGVNGKTDYDLPTATFGYANTLCTSIPINVGATWAQEMSRWSQKNFRKLFTYFGLPDPLMLDSDSATKFNILPFAAYQRIIGDYFYPWGLENDATAEENLFRKYIDDSLYGRITDAQAIDLFSLKQACFKKDYATTAQIDPQRGGLSYAANQSSSAISENSGVLVSPDNVEGASMSTAVSALALRWATNIQKYLERNNVAGARYFEQILARFGVKIAAERLQRSEYLGGNDFYVNISDVTSTATTGASGEDGTLILGSLGELAGKGIANGRSGVSYSANDYGYFIATLHLMPESGTPLGMPRMFSRPKREDWFTPELEENGMQPIYKPELWAEHFLDGATQENLEDFGVFGYIPRYAEYKYSTPLLAGDFRLSLNPDDSNYSSQEKNVMNSMHLYRLFSVASGSEFGDAVALNTVFVTLGFNQQKRFNRIFQDQNTDVDHFWTNIQVSLGAIRPMLGYVEASSPFTSEDNGRVSMPVFGTRL